MMARDLLEIEYDVAVSTSSETDLSSPKGDDRPLADRLEEDQLGVRHCLVCAVAGGFFAAVAEINHGRRL